MELKLSEAVWRAADWDQYNFLRGQKDVTTRFDPERMLAEILQMKESLREDAKTR